MKLSSYELKKYRSQGYIIFLNNKIYNKNSSLKDIRKVEFNSSNKTINIEVI